MKKNALLILAVLSVLLILTAILIPAVPENTQSKHRSYQTEEIQSIRSSSCGGYLSPYYSYEWDFETLTYTFSCTNSGSSDVEEFEQTYPFTAEDAEKMVAACNQYGAFDWKEVYGDEVSCEAGESFCINFRDGTYRYTKIYDSEKPPNYQQVLAAMFYPDENTESSQGD